MKKTNLDILKREYREIKLPNKLEVEGWNIVSGRLSSRKLGSNWSKGFAFFSVSLVLAFGGLFGLYQLSLASIPGTSLYPVKILGEKVIQKATGNDQVVVDHRAEEIVNLAKQKEGDTQKLETSVIEYKRVVTDAQEKVSTSNDQKQEDTFQKSLEKQNETFHKIVQENPEVEKELKDAIEISEHSNESPDHNESHED